MGTYHILNHIRESLHIADEFIAEKPDENPFVQHRLFGIRGGTGDFDFPCLPSGSHGYIAANSKVATFLTRNGMEIQSVLADEWIYLPTVDSIRLASLVLKFVDGGIKASHQVIRDSSHIRCLADAKFLDQQELTKAFPEIGVTQAYRVGSSVKIRAITLLGGMFDQHNLGIETIWIAADGRIELAERRVLSEKLYLARPRCPIWI